MFTSDVSGLMQLAVSFNSISLGPLLGMFLLGALVPFANAKVYCSYILELIHCTLPIGIPTMILHIIHQIMVVPVIQKRAIISRAL